MIITVNISIRNNLLNVYHMIIGINTSIRAQRLNMYHIIPPNNHIPMMDYCYKNTIRLPDIDRLSHCDNNYSLWTTVLFCPVTEPKFSGQSSNLFVFFNDVISMVDKILLRLETLDVSKTSLECFSFYPILQLLLLGSFSI